MSSLLKQHAILFEPLASTHDVQVMYIARAGGAGSVGLASNGRSSSLDLGRAQHLERKG